MKNKWITMFTDLHNDGEHIDCSNLHVQVIQ